MSLDGFVTASNTTAAEPMGKGGGRLHEWASGEERNREFLARPAAVTRRVRGAEVVVPWWRGG